MACLLLATASIIYQAQAQFDPRHASGAAGLNVQIPSPVTAGADTSVTLDLAGIAPQFIDKGDAAFRVRLYSSVANYPICMTWLLHQSKSLLIEAEGTLVEETLQQPTSFSVNIPPNVGPPGAYYALALDYAETAHIDADIAQLLEGQQSEVSWPQLEVKYSNPFFLSMPPNEQSAWIPYETTMHRQNGHQVGAAWMI
ncbi:MAG: hypothetical protein Q9162_006089 [Coniocarpon cinnabarinum]